jgi:hypothetical protein
MSKITLSGNASGTGTFTIASPNSNSDRTVNLPDAGGDMVLTTATQTLTNKTFSGAQVFGTASLAEPTGTAPLYMCRAWVNFNGTGTVAIRASGNVSSITDNGAGDYTVNFTTAMPDANYSCVTGVKDDSGAAPNISFAFAGGVYSTTQVRLKAWTFTGVAYDSSIVNVSVFR